MLSRTAIIGVLLVHLAMYVAVYSARQNTPPRAAASQASAERDLLDGLAVDFLAAHPEVIHPSMVRLNCVVYATDFSREVLERHLTTRLLVIRLGRNRPQPKVYPDQTTSRPDRVGDPPAHWITEVILSDGHHRYYDWTIRQYRPDSAVPFVWED